MTFWTLQGSLVTFLTCSGQFHKPLCQISSEFCIPKIIKIDCF